MRVAKQWGETWLYLLPSVVLTLALGIYPILWAIRYMFYDYQGYGTPIFIGLENFVRLGQDHLFWESVQNTFIYAGGKLIFTIPISLVLAVILNRAFLGRNLLKAIYFMPTIVSTAVIAIVFYVIFNSYNGMLNQLLMSLGIISEPIGWLGPKYAMLTTIIVAIWGAVGNYMLLFIAGLQSVPQDVYESASIDGANAVQKFWFITIPLLGRVMQMIVMLAIITSLKGYESIMVLTEGGPIGKTEVMFLYVYKLLFPFAGGSDATVQQFGYGSAAAFVTALIVGVITILYFYFSKRTSHD
ncbi:sugar ABC transporter permease [Paenibacillus sp. PL2-23]|uniref:carbohydrate ABC transporter permease n=1 Tax=Paenibacillus sp. PL2-23 TaxID=2100729 RepID=UPI0030FCA1E1